MRDGVFVGAASDNCPRQSYGCRDCLNHTIWTGDNSVHDYFVSSNLYKAFPLMRERSIVIAKIGVYRCTCMSRNDADYV